MDASFIPVEVVPSKTPFGLDQLRRSYKSALSAEEAIAAAPDVGTADEIFPNMFLMPVSTPESAESATRIDLIYMGCLRGVAGTPVLPASTQKYSSTVQTASSGITVAGATSPTVSMQFYGQTSETVFMTYAGPGVTGTAPDPLSDPVVISVTVQDATYAPSSVGIAAFIAAYFVILTTDVIQSQEVVAGGKFWVNTEVKTNYYGPPLFIV